MRRLSDGYRPDDLKVGPGGPTSGRAAWVAVGSIALLDLVSHIHSQCGCMAVIVVLFPQPLIFTCVSSLAVGLNAQDC